MVKNSERLALLIKESLTSLKLRLGSRCTYLSFEKEGDATYLCANLKNSIGGIDKVRQKISTTVEDLTFGDFEDMFNILNEELYVGN